MPRLNAIVLDRKPTGILAIALWADVPLARQPFYASTGRISAWKDATLTDNSNLQNGIIAERVDVVNILPGMTSTDVQSLIASAWTQYQNTVTNFNPWRFYGTTWDGTVWTTTGVA